MLKRMEILQVKQLSVDIRAEKGLFTAVDRVSFNLRQGETLALLGESGCGKSITALALMQLLPPAAQAHKNSEINFSGTNLLELSEVELRHFRGRKIAMIFQEPMTSLNPVMTVGQQIAEVICQHFSLPKSACRERVINLLKDVGIPDPEKRYADYPHQLSGGMKQRVMIAMALAGEPEILIADEPTTALDVTIQLQILQLLKELQRKTGMAMLFITHDLGVAKLVSDRVAVMYAGEVVEESSAYDFFNKPLHPYSQGLMNALPSIEKRDQQLEIIPGRVPDRFDVVKACRFAERCAYAWEDCREVKPTLLNVNEQMARCHLYDKSLAPEQIKHQHVAQTELVSSAHSQDSLLEVNNLKVHFPIQKGLFKRVVGYVKAVDGIHLTLKAGKTLALVGESGCGKTTTGRAILQLIDANAGSVNYQLEDITQAKSKRLHELRRDLQIIFQDAYSAMNPRMMVYDILAEGVRAHHDLKENDLKTYLLETLQKVGLDDDCLYRYPHQFSGGQRQRLCIARALCVQPKVIVCDEPTSALDVSVQAQILNLLRSLQSQEGLAYLFITHNISVVSYIADEVAVMYLGRIVESGPVKTILDKPKHPYTQALLAAVPEISKSQLKENTVKGEQPSPINPPSGCHFHPRCPHAMDICKKHYPDVTVLEGEHEVTCYLYSQATKEQSHQSDDALSLHATADDH